MHQKLLTKKFFKDNPYKEISAQRLIYTLLSYEGIEKLSTEISQQYLNLSTERIDRISAERKMIAQLQDPEEILQLMRKNIDGFNRCHLVDKALEFEADMLPLIVDKLTRSDHDTFIDNSVRFLAGCKSDYATILKHRYGEIRSPYVKSIACILLGFKADESLIPWMLEQFYELKKFYPGEKYDQGPLFGLHELFDRFYK